MAKAGSKIIAGMKEALAVAKGTKMPARVTRYAYMIWSPKHGLFGIPRETAAQARGLRLYKHERVVKVKITTV